MRTNEERITALHIRAADLEKEQKDRRFRLVCGISAALCLVVLTGIAVLIPRLSTAPGFDDITAGMSASVFTGSSVPGYLVIAILSFLLGVTLTVFCFRLKKYLDEKDTGEQK